MRDGSDRVASVLDVIYDNPDGNALRADLYLPRAVAAPSPVVIWVHGGGWRYGSRRASPDLARCFARRGMAMVAVDYRLTDSAVFPAQIRDLRTAIRWVRTVADTYDLDAGHIALWGASAGGHLAALAALCPPGMFEPPGSPYGDRSSTVQAVAAGYAPIDFLLLDEDRPAEGSVAADPENLSLPSGMRSADPHSFESLLMGAPIHTCPVRVREANPLTYVGPGAPPFLILHGLSDTTVGWRQSERLYKALACHGNDVALCLVEGLGHGFLNRGHLDDGSPWRMTVRTHRHGRERAEVRVQAILPMIEAFFRSQASRPGPASNRRTGVP